MQCLPNTFPIFIEIFQTFLGFFEKLFAPQCCLKHYHIMRPDFHHLQILPEDVESCLIFGNLVFLIIDVGIVSNHAVNKAVSSRNHEMSGLVFCSKGENSRAPLDGVDTHCVVQHLPCCRNLHHSRCRYGEGDEGDDDNDVLHTIRFMLSYRTSPTSRFYLKNHFFMNFFFIIVIIDIL